MHNWAEQVRRRFWHRRKMTTDVSSCKTWLFNYSYLEILCSTSEHNSNHVTRTNSISPKCLGKGRAAFIQLLVGQFNTLVMWNDSVISPSCPDMSRQKLPKGHWHGDRSWWAMNDRELVRRHFAGWSRRTNSRIHLSRICTNQDLGQLYHHHFFHLWQSSVTSKACVPSSY